MDRYNVESSKIRMECLSIKPSLHFQDVATKWNKALE